MRTFNKGDVVRHFKRETVDASSMTYLYEIVGVATHSETDEDMMVYRALYKVPAENPRAFRPWDEWRLEYIFY